MIRLLLIDDDPADLLLFREMFTGSATPWLRDVTFDTMQRPPTDEVLATYEGVITDFDLKGSPENGVDVGMRCHALSVPVVLLTDMHVSALPLHPLDTFDYVARKSVSYRSENIYDPHSVTRAFVRTLSRNRK